MSVVSLQRCDIVFLIRSMGRGGAERQLSLLARALHARGLNVAVAVFYAGGALERELHDAGVQVYDLGKRGRWSNTGVVRRFMRFVRQRQPRVVHSYMPTQNVMALLLKPWLARQGCILACGIRIASLDMWRYGLVAGVVGAMQGRLLSRADRVISNSVQALRELGGRVPSGCGFAIPNGVEHERFTFFPDKRSKQRSVWGKGEGDVLLGVVGRLDPQKNHRLLLDALRRVGDDMPDVCVVFIGDGLAEYRQAVQAHADALGLASRVLWAGASDDLAAVYSALDFVCLSSVAEGFPNVIAEAMCAGLPCVATDVGDVADLMGDCGWTVPAGDARALADALLLAYRGLPGWDRERPRTRMIRHFSVDALADRTLAALEPGLRQAGGSFKGASP